MHVFDFLPFTLCVCNFACLFQGDVTCDFDGLFVESISESGSGVSRLVCDSCMELKETQISPPQTAETSCKNVSPVVQPRYPFYLLYKQ